MTTETKTTDRLAEMAERVARECPWICMTMKGITQDVAALDPPLPGLAEAEAKLVARIGAAMLARVPAHPQESDDRLIRTALSDAIDEINTPALSLQAVNHRLGYGAILLAVDRIAKHAGDDCGPAIAELDRLGVGVAIEDQVRRPVLLRAVAEHHKAIDAMCSLHAADVAEHLAPHAESKKTKAKLLDSARENRECGERLLNEYCEKIKALPEMETRIHVQIPDRDGAMVRVEGERVPLWVRDGKIRDAWGREVKRDDIPNLYLRGAGRYMMA